MVFESVIDRVGFYIMSENTVNKYLDKHNWDDDNTIFMSRKLPTDERAAYSENVRSAFKEYIERPYIRFKNLGYGLYLIENKNFKKIKESVM